MLQVNANLINIPNCDEKVNMRKRENNIPFFNFSFDVIGVLATYGKW